MRIQREGGAQHGALRSGRRDSQTLFPPTPLGFGGPAPCELSLTPQTGRERDPSKTCFSARAGSSAVTGSNQRRGAFLPRRRDPRCKKTQRHGPHRFRCSLPRTSEVPPGSPRSSPPPNCSGGPHQFLLLRPQLRFLSFSFPTPYVSTFAGHKSSFSKLAGTIWGIRNRPQTRPLRSEASQGPARTHRRPEALFSGSQPCSSQALPGTLRCPGSCLALHEVSLSASALSSPPPLLFIASHNGFFFPPPPIQ